MLRLLLAAAVAAWVFMTNSVSAASRSPMGGGDTIVVQPVPAATPRTQIRRLVYTCMAPGLITFSDTPCGPLPELRELRLRTPDSPRADNVPAPPASSARTSSPSSGRKNERGASETRDEANDRATTCERLEQAVENLDDRMRAGYSAREAARLWARWREAKERLRESDC